VRDASGMVDVVVDMGSEARLSRVEPRAEGISVVVGLVVRMASRTVVLDVDGRSAHQVSDHSVRLRDVVVRGLGLVVGFHVRDLDSVGLGDLDGVGDLLGESADDVFTSLVSSGARSFVAEGIIGNGGVRVATLVGVVALVTVTTTVGKTTTTKLAVARGSVRGLVVGRELLDLVVGSVGGMSHLSGVGHLVGVGHGVDLGDHVSGGVVGDGHVGLGDLMSGGVV